MAALEKGKQRSKVAEIQNDAIVEEKEARDWRRSGSRVTHFSSLFLHPSPTLTLALSLLICETGIPRQLAASCIQNVLIEETAKARERGGRKQENGLNSKNDILPARFLSQNSEKIYINFDQIKVFLNRTCMLTLAQSLK